MEINADAVREWSRRDESNTLFIPKIFQAILSVT